MKGLRFVHLAALRAGTAPAEPVGVWLPGEAFAVHRLPAPPVSRRKLLAMAPWLLEERLLGSPEGLAFAVGPRGPDGTVPVLCASRSALEDWREALAGVPWRLLAPDFYLLPWSDQALHCTCLEDRWLARFDRFSGLAGPAELVFAALERARGERPVVVLLPPGAPVPEAVRERGWAVETWSAPEEVARWDGLAIAEGIAPRRLLGVRALLAAALALAVLANLAAENGRLARQEAELAGLLPAAVAGPLGEGLAELGRVLRACADCRLAALTLDGKTLAAEVVGGGDALAARALLVGFTPRPAREGGTILRLERELGR